MQIERTHQCDVLVIGAGIAGIRAAIAAKRQGASVILAAQGHIFSGSSFYPGTWGLGLIAPTSAEDAKDLSAHIQTVGCGMATPDLVDHFVSGIAPAISQIQDMGIALKTAQEKTQTDFIPCFDHKHRAWYGILFDSARHVWQQALDGVEQLPHCTLLQLTMDDSGVTGAIFQQGDSIFWIASGAVVLATGGYSGLYQRRLTTDDVTGMGQYLAVQCGATLLNLEFMQMMPAFVHPCYGTIFNEKTFRYVHFYDANHIEISIPQQLLTLRGTYGPFTSRLPSRAIDAIFAETPTTVRYSKQMQAEMPELIQTYFQWLHEEKGLNPQDPVSISSFAHASNGGIQIDTSGFTGVPHLYACGEVTGGMHGADRIGGLSTANGLVFGELAGKNAALSHKSSHHTSHTTLDAFGIPDCTHLRTKMRQIMQTAGMVNRHADQLSAGIDALCQIQQIPHIHTTQTSFVADSLLLSGQLALAKWILQAASLREESRGSHYRTDFPKQSLSTKRILVQNEHVHFET